VPAAISQHAQGPFSDPRAEPVEARLGYLRPALRQAQGGGGIDLRQLI